MENMLYQACLTGDLSLVKAIKPSLWQLKPYKIRSAGYLHWACEYGGHLSVVQWMHSAIGLSQSDTQAHDSLAIYCACRLGRLSILKWLHSEIGLNVQTIRASKNRILINVCMNGHFAVAKWLFATFDLTAEDVQIHSSCALRFAFAAGRLHVVQLLCKVFELTLANVTMVYAMCEALGKGHIHVIQWACMSYQIAKPAELKNWSRNTHHLWYWQPHVMAAATRLPTHVLHDVLRRM